MYVRFPKLPLVLLFIYFMEYWITGMNWWWFVAFERALFGDNIVNAHIAFCVIGSILFVLFASPVLFWAYYFRAQMPPRTRRNCLIFAMSIAMLFHDFPLWLMEFWFVWQFGWIHILQGVSICVLTVTTGFGLFAVWLGYTWKVSKFLQRYYGSASYSLGGPMGGTAIANPALALGPPGIRAASPMRSPGIEMTRI